MSLNSVTPCDGDGFCPYNSVYSHDCEYWCGTVEAEDFPNIWEEDDDYDYDFAARLGDEAWAEAQEAYNMIYDDRDDYDDDYSDDFDDLMTKWDRFLFGAEY